MYRQSGQTRMNTRLSNPTLRASIFVSMLGIVCCGALGTAWPGSAQGAEREICDKMTGEQLRRCIEDAARGQPAPGTTGTPARASNPPAASGAIILPSTQGKAAVSPEPTNSRILNCTKVAYVDQSFCAFRNSALLECG